MRDSPSNNALERTLRHGGPRLAAARSSWPAAQLGRYTAECANRLLDQSFQKRPVNGRPSASAVHRSISPFPRCVPGYRLLPLWSSWPSFLCLPATSCSSAFCLSLATSSTRGGFDPCGCLLKSLFCFVISLSSQESCTTALDKPGSHGILSFGSNKRFIDRPLNFDSELEPARLAVTSRVTRRSSGP
jgi:hypothetical protein